MALDIGKSLKVATIPIVVLIVLGIASNLVSLIPFLGCIVGIPILVVSMAVLGWAGFKAAKEAGMDLVGGAVTGGLAGLISGIVNGIIGFVLSVLGIGVGMAMGGSDVGGAALGAGFVLIGVVVGVVFSLVLGLVMGAIGAFVAGMKK